MPMGTIIKKGEHKHYPFNYIVLDKFKKINYPNRFKSLYIEYKDIYNDKSLIRTIYKCISRL